MQWSKEMDAVLFEHPNWSAELLVEKISTLTAQPISRNAVIGRRYRLKIKSRILKRKKKKSQQQKIIIKEAAPAPGILFTQRQSHQCAWPMWSDSTPVKARTVCGELVTHQQFQWCDLHKRIGLRRF